MTSNLGKAGTMKGHDAMHRARKRDTHRTRPRRAGFRHFLGGRCARSFGGAVRTHGFPPFRERAHRALREAQP
jgi:hypothetical protein